MPPARRRAGIVNDTQDPDHGRKSAAPAAPPAGAAAASPAARRFDALMDDAVDQILRLSPEYATALGLDNGARADLKSRLGTVSHEDDARWDAMVHALSARLAGIDRMALDARRRTLYDTVRVHVDDGLAGMAFPVIGGGWGGFMGGASPYVISQMGSAMTSVPSMLDTQHRIAGRADAEAYLARLAMLGPLLDAESARLNEQAALDMLPPDFILRTALGQLRGILALPVAKQTLVTSIAARTRAKRIGGDWEGRARRIVANDVYPALRRQIAAVDRALAQATGALGVDRLPDGAAYYRWALKVSTTIDMGPDDIHRLGIEQGRELESRMDTVLRAQERTEGTVGARMLALATDPAFLYPDDERGRERLIADCNARIAALRADAARLAPGTQGAADDQARAGGSEGRRTAGLHAPGTARRRRPPGHLLHQPEIHPVVAALSFAHAQRARRHSRPRPADRVRRQTRSAKAGRCTRSRWSTNWGCTTTIHMRGSATCRNSACACAAWWWTPACTTRAGRAGRPSTP